MRAVAILVITALVTLAQGLPSPQISGKKPANVHPDVVHFPSSAVVGQSGPSLAQRNEAQPQEAVQLAAAAPSTSSLELVKLGDNNYYFSNVNNKLNWTSARDFCHTNGLSLANIQSIEENQLVNAYAKRLYERRLWAQWLGGSDASQEGNWAWDGTEKALTYDNWDSDKPGGGEAKNCLVMHRSDGAWSDFECEREFMFICKLVEA